MFNVLDKSFIHRSYPKLAYGSIYIPIFGRLVLDLNSEPLEPKASVLPMSYAYPLIVYSIFLKIRCRTGPTSIGIPR